jgi:DNA-binding transcriptional regulator GbsR (MarR family)
MQKELIKKTGLSRFTISYNMRKFVDIGLIKKSNNEKSVYYEYMTDELLRREIFLRLTIEFLNKEIDEKTFNDLKAKLGIDEPDES